MKAKHQQLISGVWLFFMKEIGFLKFLITKSCIRYILITCLAQVSVLSYWTSTYIWDFVSFLFPSSFALILFYIFGMLLDLTNCIIIIDFGFHFLPDSENSFLTFVNIIDAILCFPNAQL